jgi:hypothetical protein
LPSSFPIPACSPRGEQGRWDNFQLDLLRGPTQRYGPTVLATEVVARVFGVPSAIDLDKLPKPPSQ